MLIKLINVNPKSVANTAIIQITIKHSGTLGLYFIPSFFLSFFYSSLNKQYANIKANVINPRNILVIIIQASFLFYTFILPSFQKAINVFMNVNVFIKKRTRFNKFLTFFIIKSYQSIPISVAFFSNQIAS